MLKLSLSKPFHNTLNYASTANIEEVMKFYNLGHKTFETDFGCYDQRVVGEIPNLLILRLLSVKLKNFHDINRQHLLNLLKFSPGGRYYFVLGAVLLQ